MASPGLPTWRLIIFHGLRQKDYNLDEIDGFDEAICPIDFETEGPIIDDEINATIVRPLPRGVKLHAVIDTCFSGTVLDLLFMYRIISRLIILHFMINVLLIYYFS